MNAEDTVKVSKLRALFDSGTAKPIRISKSLSLGEAAEAADSHPTTIWRWENGSRRPHGEVAVRYYEFLTQLIDGQRDD